jgi:carboxymethylenebutenolidase
MKEDIPQISIATADGGSFAAYLALPETTPAPAVVCIQEVYGVNRFMRAITDFWASQGFVAISPDIYWRLRSGVEFDPEVDGDGDRAMALASELDRPQAVEDIAAAISHLRDMAECTGKVGTTGYCLGGLLSYLIGTRHDADCNIGYYPVGIENVLDEAERLSRRIMLHIGESDPYTPPEVRAQLATALGGNALASIHFYPDIGHAFARPGAPSHVPQAADLANERSAAFFRKHLA